MNYLTDIQKNEIRKFCSKLPSWASHVGKELNVRISPEEILIALVYETGKELHELSYIQWTQNDILKTIENSHLIKSLPVIKEIIEVQDSIIPPGTICSLYEEQIKYKGEKWIVHKNDVDPFPSVPHAHNYESGLKMHLGSGELYHGAKLVGRIKKNNLIKLRGLFKRTKLPELQI